MLKDRIKYIDVVETIAIFLVVYCHFTSTIGESIFANLTLQFAAVAVPLFFLANGALLFEKELIIKDHYRKTLLLFLATVIWKAVYLVISILGYKYDLSMFNVYGLMRYFIGFDYLDPYVPALHFWFIYVLIVLYIFFPIFKRLYDNNKTVLLIVMGIVFIVLYSFDLRRCERMPYFVEYFAYFLFFLLGPFLHRFFYKRQIGCCRIMLLVLSTISFAFLAYQKYVIIGSLSGTWIRLPYDYQRVAMFLFAASLFSFFASLDFSDGKVLRFFEFVSIRTMNIYVVHFILCYLFEVFIYPYIGLGNIAIHLLRTVIIIVLSIVLTEPFAHIPIVRDILALRGGKNKSE